jgi:hypothetical protein
MGYRDQMAHEFAERLTALGFRVFIARDGTGDYGCISDATGERVLSFSFNDGGSLGGNYGPPSSESGTGWRLELSPSDLRTAGDVRRALYANPPQWVGRGWRNLTTLKTYLGFYGSSRYAEYVPRAAG